MRAILCADLHGKRTRVAIFQKLLRAITTTAKRERATHVICVGDLFDEKQGTHVEVLTCIADELGWARSQNIEWVWIRGNHEIGVKSQPHQTLMSVFRGLCTVVIEPSLWDVGDAVIAMLPWYPAKEFIALSNYLRGELFQFGGKYRVLLSHVGVDEGRASPSNFYVKQAVGLVHLNYEAYHLVCLGDYHHQQYLTDNTLYLGVPISHEHGDDLENGVWLLDTSTRSLDRVKLPGNFPRHITVTPPNPENPLLLGYRESDILRIRVAPEFEKIWKAAYPSAQIVAVGKKETDGSARRMKDVQDRSPIGVWNALCLAKQITPEVHWLGLEILGKVPARIAQSQK